MKTWIFFATALSLYATENSKFSFSGKIILTEIMADPSPGLGFLPEVEYLEIFNADSEAISLLNYILQIGNTSLTLPDYSIQSQEFLVLSKGPDSIAPNQIFLPKFPALNNTGTSISLIDPLGKLIFKVEYKDSWYRETAKKSGGWSLELIDLNKPIHCMHNWIAHPSSKGGSPGESFPFDDTFKDQIPPYSIQLLLESEQNLQVIFSEPMDLEILKEPENYFWIEENLHPSKVSITEKEAFLSFEKTIERGKLNSLELYSSLQDCIGNFLIDTILEFGKGKFPEAGDLLINEIMFDPLSNCPTYLEVFNNTSQYLELSDFQLITGFPEKSLDLPQKFLEPQDFFVLTRDNENLKKCHPNLRPLSDIQVGSYSLSRDSGELKLWSNLTEIDRVTYSNFWHHPFVDPTRGISLERLSLSRSGAQSSNWHSASIPTPGFANSQSISIIQNQEFIQLSTQIITPNGDGDHDFLIIQYQADQPGYLLNIYLFDQNGIPLGLLLNQERTSSAGQVIWNGTESNGVILNPGLYILLCQWTHPEGKVHASKHVIHLDY